MEWYSWYSKKNCTTLNSFKKNYDDFYGPNRQQEAHDPHYMDSAMHVALFACYHQVSNKFFDMNLATLGSKRPSISLETSLEKKKFRLKNFISRLSSNNSVINS